MKLRTLAAMVASLTLWSSSVRAQEAPVRVGDFSFVREVDAMTDRNSSRLLVPAAGASGIRSAPVMFWRCGPLGVIEVGVDTHEYLGDGPVRAQWRWDNAEPVGPSMWGNSTDGTHAFVRRGDVASFTEMAMASARLRVRVWDFRSVAYDFDFSMSGVTRGVGMLGCPVPEAGNSPSLYDPELVRNARYIGDVLTKAVYPRSCGLVRVREERRSYFMAESEALANGYRPGVACSN